MSRGHQLVILVVASTLLVGVGCVKKKPQLPAEAKAPVDPIAIPLPDEISETVPPPPPPKPEPQTQAPEVSVTKPPKRHNRKKITPPTASVQAASPPASTASNNNTVAMAHPPANPAEVAPDAAIAADVTTAQLTRQKQSTAQLLEETEKSINGLKDLSAAEEETLAQIRSYLNQSRKATSDGDFERAYNLATKAHLLSDALVKK